MQIRENKSLKSFLTMGLQVSARWYAEPENKPDLEKLWTDENLKNIPKFVLGGGSNTLFLQDYPGMVVRLCNKGIEEVNRTAEYVDVAVQAGEVWKDFAALTVERGWWGVENLSGIPGNAGGAAVQNMGAYGAEISQVVRNVEVFDTRTLQWSVLPVEQCNYVYRGSIFKGNSRYIVWRVLLRLSLRPVPCLQYTALKNAFEPGEVPPQKRIAETVLEIRASKLPDVEKTGSVGSFFTNPVVGLEMYEDLKRKYPDIPGHISNREVKLSAAWLIDRCGWKGYRRGDAGVYEKQPLVLVNYGNASGTDIWDLAQEIRTSVRERFGVVISPEVCVIGERVSRPVQ